MKKIILILTLAFYFSIGYSQEPLSAEDYVIAGKSQMSIGNYVRATEYFTQAIILDKNNVQGYIGRATAKGCTKDFYGAIYDLETALKIDSKNHIALFKMGLTKYQIGAKDIACQYWKQANALGNPDAYRYISKYCY